MNNKIVYTPGPTNVRENVRQARSIKTTNPDIDLDFVEFYKETCDALASMMKTKNDVYLLCGEGILGLEAACASLIEKGDRVLVIDNGIFGNGFKDFVSMYGGEVVLFSQDHRNSINTDELEKFLEYDNDFKFATIVHCDTPTGVLNDLSTICPLLKKHNILTVVDSVAAMFGEKLLVDEWKIDIILGGSQKALSAQPGLTIVSLSEEAKKSIKNRKTNIIGFYCNLSIWDNYYENKYFPYTMPISDILSLRKAVDNIIEDELENVITRHEKISKATRRALSEYGLKLFLESGFSNTVTAIEIPKEIGALNLVNYILNTYNVVIGTSLGEYKNSLLRLGHMGENARLENIIYILNILDKSLTNLGLEGSGCLVNLFNKYYE